MCSNFLNHSRLNSQHDGPGGGVRGLLPGCLMTRALLTSKNHNSNRGDQNIPLIVAKISYNICGSKKDRNSEI